MSGYVLRGENICKSFAGNQALKNVNFALRPGQVMGLVGENGAGKSTLVKVIAGIYELNSGTIFLNDQPVAYANSLQALHAGIAIMHQELNLFTNLSVYENIYLDRKEYRSSLGKIDRKRMREDARSLLQRLGTDIDPDAQVLSLRIRERQIVEVARAVSVSAKVLIMDEPSAALTEGEVQKMFEIVRALKAQGVAVIYVSHRMNEIRQICDTVLVLRDGENVGELEVADTEIHDIVELMVGRRIENYYPRNKHAGGETVLEVKELTSGWLQDVSFQLSSYEILGLYGLAGSGITDLAECLFGLRKISKGSIWVKEKRLNGTGPSEAIRNGLAYVPSDRRNEGIVTEFSVENNLILSSYKKYSFAGLFLRKKEIGKTAARSIMNFNIKTRDGKQQIRFLSGGNQQKVVLAKWLETEPGVLILNEPTRGVDVGAKAEIYAQIDRLAAQGMGILFISSEVPEIAGMADRVLVINKGRVAAEIPSDQCTQERLLACASGKDVQSR
ncbi:MAG: sugar ABC transporter ATP-binding protein [Synergistaceae bacterium]|jgi:ABC-type sugar transport system ATPase subunit|nr:sugar ABC transporter ATP-binding protein [Synergistaceae bacterium]